MHCVGSVSEVNLAGKGLIIFFYSRISDTTGGRKHTQKKVSEYNHF